MNKRITLSITVLILSAAAWAGQGTMAMTSRYAGPVYNGKPRLDVTSALVKAGGGPSKFSTAKAVMAIAGKALTQKEIAKLTKQYGKEKIASWIKVGDFAVADALKLAIAAGVKLPSSGMTGKALGGQLVKLGLSKNTFYVETMLDTLLTHGIHDKVMDDIDVKFGQAADANYHKVSNQAYVDLAHALGMKGVKLADFH